MQVILVQIKGDIVATVKQLLIQLLVTKLYSSCGTMNEISIFHSALIIPLKMIGLNVDSTTGKKKKRLLFVFCKMFNQMGYFQNPRAHESEWDTLELVLSRFH